MVDAQAMMVQPEVPVADTLLPNRWIHAFAGACVACVGLAFFFLDRRYGDIGATTLPWLLATLVGFGTGAAMLGRDGAAGRAVCAVLGLAGLALAVFPSFLIYSLLRWMALCLLFVCVARAPLMRTRRDLYFSLLMCFVAICVVAIHYRADWLLWTYLGPACLFAGLALTMEHVATRDISNAVKLISSALFVGATVLLAVLLFLWIPRPPVLGFGFLPPPVAQGSPASASTPTTAGNEKSSPASSGASVGSVTSPGKDSPWVQMLRRMRADLRDPTIPEWQRRLFDRMLDALETIVVGPGTGSQHAPAASPAMGELGEIGVVFVRVKVKLVSLFAWVVMLALAAICWWQRNRLVFSALDVASWALAGIHPLSSMRLSARMMAVGLAQIENEPTGAKTLREVVTQTLGLPALARRWYDEALDTYHAVRFGCLVPSSSHARSLRQTVLDATELALDARRDQSSARPFGRLPGMS